MSERKWLINWSIMLILKSHAFTDSQFYSRCEELCSIVANMKWLPEAKFYQEPTDDHKNYMPGSQGSLKLSSNLTPSSIIIIHKEF